MTAFQKIARKLHEEIVLKINEQRGQVHPSLIDSAVDFGKCAGLKDKNISLNLRVAGVKPEDAEGAIKAAK